MCGIVGIVSFLQQPIEELRLRQMMQVVKHRGPNDEGIYLQDNVGLGHVRLSILDLSMAGHQPMQDETGRYTIVLNGEIYNFIELREQLEKVGVEFASNSDTEVLLKGYIYYGQEVLDKLNGMFAFAIYDAERKELFAARDRFGVKPFYYYQSDKEFIFASEIPAILEVYGKKNRANETAVFDYLAFNRTDQTEDTFFEGVKKLQHGHSLVIKEGKLSISCWYNLRERVQGKRLQSDEKEFLNLLEDSIRIRLRSDVPVGVCLSGGLDSSSIVSIISERLEHPEVNTFSAVYESKYRADESEFINLYKDKLPNMHFTYPTYQSLFEDLNSFIACHAEPVPSTGPYAQYCTMRLAGQHVTVTLDGQGADEELGGYHYFYGLYYKSLLKRLKLITLIKEMVKYVAIHRSSYALQTFVYFLLPNKLRVKARVNERGYMLPEFANRFQNSVIADNLYGSKSMQDALINHFEYKLEHLLKWDDRNSMQFSVESRTPFLDYRLVEYLLKTEDSAKIKDGYTKSLLRRSMKGLLPDRIRLRRDKVGFATPEEVWFAEKEFHSLIESVLNSDSFRNRGIVDPEKARKLYDKHCKGEIGISKDIWKWINLEMWYRTFIDS
jgi:asparagine synthase (glutamine-hydrolysing)